MQPQPQPQPQSQSVAQNVKQVSLNSVVLQRLIKEVKMEKEKMSCVGGNYDRVHNRHNR
ncbi:TPA: YhhA family cyclophane-containing RiPP [Acinetobacter baumannii]